MSLKLSVFGLLAIVVCAAYAIDDPAITSLISSIDDLDNEKSLYLFEGLSIEKVDVPMSGPRSVTSDVLERALQYMESHQIKFTVPEDDNEIEGAFN